MLELRGVSKRYGDLVAVAPTDLVIERGSTTVLLGPSGCGKSTLLRMIVGLVTPDAGEIHFGGQVVGPGNIMAVRRRMGYVIQEGGLFPHLTVRGNVQLMARHIGWDRDRCQSRLAELLALTQLPEDVVDRFPGQISGGQRQRVSLIRALFLDPDVLLLDEPLGALDPLIRADLQEQLREIFATLHKTVVLVTHDIGEAGYLADGIALLRDGRIVQRGSLADLVRRPADRQVTEFIRAQRGPLDDLPPEDA